MSFKVWLLVVSVMSESLKRVQKIFFFIDADFDTSGGRGHTKKVAFQLVYKYWSRLSLRPQKKSSKRDNDSLLCFGRKN